ncbi:MULTISPECIES: NUDIX hydrolase [unclassified Pseudonocardia]|uniref:NUDIX hydrolase n=1 Tax=unclassified Pseudonocardia TaxID=2619320 RepID=UPI001CF62ACD|nr:NUDIX hydrolase [Pseudonocardia sp. ICBG601]
MSDDPAAQPVEPRAAATVLLVRDEPGTGDLQVFLQRRVAGMAFAGGMTVFPGGGVSAGDEPDPARWRGPEPARFGARLAQPADLAAALVTAAVRETFEECGVLLAAPAGTEPGPLDTAAAWRDDLVAHRTTLPELLAAHDLELRADLLVPWARWITPPRNPKRYDTAFLVARVPDGQVADDATTEAVEARWWSPAEALSGYDDGDLKLMPPTLRTLQELHRHDSAGEVLAAAAARDIEPITPEVRREGRIVTITLPGDPDWIYEETTR